jgi:hypothetical protein
MGVSKQGCMRDGLRCHVQVNRAFSAWEYGWFRYTQGDGPGLV